VQCAALAEKDVKPKSAAPEPRSTVADSVKEVTGRSPLDIGPFSVRTRSSAVFAIALSLSAIESLLVQHGVVCCQS